MGQAAGEGVAAHDEPKAGGEATTRMAEGSWKKRT